MKPSTEKYSCTRGRTEFILYLRFAHTQSTLYSKNFIFIYLFISFLLTINLKLIIVHVEIKIVNKEAATKRSTLLHAQRHACMVVHGRCTFEQSDVMLIRKGKRKEDN